MAEVHTCTAVLHGLEKQTGKKWALLHSEGFVPKFLNWESAQDFEKPGLGLHSWLEDAVVLDPGTLHFALMATETSTIFFASQQEKDEYLALALH